MPPPPATAHIANVHERIPFDDYVAPKPFQTFAVRSEELRHADLARAPYALVHVIHTDFLDARALADLASHGQSHMNVRAFADIDYSPVTHEDLCRAAPHVEDIVGGIAAALRSTQVIGDALDIYRRSVESRIDYLGSRGAGFHNDVSRHWTACLFWNLTLAAHDVEFVMPHAGLRIALIPGDLIVFDQTMAHGLCRPKDDGQAVAPSFEREDGSLQVFLSGELALTDAQWAALGSPWLPVDEHHRRGALELMAAEFDERTGAIKRPTSLLQCLLQSTRYVDADPPRSLD